MIYDFDNLSFQVLNVALFLHKTGTYHVKARPFASLAFRLSGNATFEIANKRFVSHVDDVTFIPAYQSYKAEYSVGESIVVHLDRCNYYNAENIYFENQSAIELCFRRMLVSWNERYSVNQAKLNIYDILEKMANDIKISIKDTSFAKCVRYINENFCDPNLNIGTVCSFGFVSGSGLQRAFKRYFGISPKQYLNNLRMNRALKLLAENELSIKEIAFSCGFLDEKYFSRAFKRIYGCSPSQLRKNIVV